MNIINAKILWTGKMNSKLKVILQSIPGESKNDLYKVVGRTTTSGYWTGMVSYYDRYTNELVAEIEYSAGVFHGKYEKVLDIGNN